MNYVQIILYVIKYENETNPRSINGHSTHKIKYEKKSPITQINMF